MRKIKRERLAAAGWRLGDAAEFLDLSPEEAEFVELKLALARSLRSLRERQGWTQDEVARRIASSQSRVAKMEAADRSVSLDLLVRALLSLGATSVVMKEFTTSVARQRLPDLMESAQRDGGVRIRDSVGRVFVLSPEESAARPLDVRGIDLNIATGGIVGAVHEGRGPAPRRKPKPRLKRTAQVRSR